jgi:hypothetical protein
MITDVRTVLQDLPGSIRGFVVLDENGDPTIVLNARYNRETNLETYRHELEHIKAGDFHRHESADEIESRAHA